MLRELRIENLLLIERAELRLGEGLNAITGETGAGKTVLAHSLDLLMGGKARTGIVRPGAEEAWVEGVFDLPAGLLEEPEFAEIAERLPEDAEEIVLGRRVATSGRTSAFVGGRAASATDLKALGGRLLGFYGQHEHRRLTISSSQLDVLDGFAGREHLELRQAYRLAHRECLRLEAELAELRERDGSRERDLDLYRYELSEIEAVAPDPDERAQLAAERERLRHAEGLREAVGGAHGAVSGLEDGDGGAEGIARGQALLHGVEGVDAQVDGLAQRLSGLAIELGEVSAELRSYVEGLESAPGRLAAIEERLEAIDRLERKHGGSVESVLAHAERCRSEIARLAGVEERGAEAEAALEEAGARRLRLAEELTAGRREASGPLERAVAEELEMLAMPGARLEVELVPHPQRLGASGAETVELRLAPNPGLEPAPLREAASGGELSRVMLALCRLGGVAGTDTLVFDEIDAGVGGTTARTVGERLRALGEDRQVICITHLPQVASLAGTHFTLEKDASGERATAEVRRLEGESVVGEIRRMLGGEHSDEAATRHARERLAAA